ncbi:MAG: zinc/manganese transport system permease protein [Bradyrhizobium sp.]|jgi:zinc/manganese transport system permease protein|nr:zinc/manganese transport system permease protein [Bradyrhizobium sp.]
MIEPLLFLWPAFLVAVCLVGIHVYFGIQVLARQVIFVDLALAQIAALGGTVAFMLGHPVQSPATYGYSLGFTLLAAVLLAFTRAWGTRVPQEALIGVIYVVAAAAAILLIDRAPQGAEHLKQILTGNILTSGWNELAVIAPLYAAVGLLHWLLRRQLAGTGIVWEFVFYASFGLVVTSSVAIAGVLLVFSFLIVPAAIGVLFASSPPRQLAIGWITGTLTSAAGLATSFILDLPTGAAMVCAFGLALAVAGALYPFLRGNRDNALRVAIASVRWCAAVLLAGAALQLALAPRADQPLLDAIEYAIPSLRTLYFSRSEAVTWAEASEYAERHRIEAERLNDLEKRNRSEGEALDDFSIARMSSFLKSYGEMRRGEQFVMGEVRARARERVRWSVSLALLALALLCAPVGWPRLRMRSRRS